MIDGQRRAPTALEGYLATRARGVPVRGDIARRIVRLLIPGAIRPVLQTGATRAVAPWARRRAGRLGAVGEIRLHLGSGLTPLAGWVNVDLFGNPVELPWDLRMPFPLPDGVVAAIFHEHLLEHLPLEAGLALLKECHRLLTPGGVLRSGVPDAGAYLRAYAEGDDGFFQLVRSSRPTRLLAVREVFQDHGHQAAYDLETLVLLMETAGFSEVSGRAVGDSRISPCPDGDHRRLETLYVEGVR
jgi:predicted SAM-dependent methyltransferase